LVDAVVEIVFMVQAPRGGDGVCWRGNFQTTTPPRLAWILSQANPSVATMMTAQQTPTERLLAIFVPLMENEGYAYRKTHHRFIKKFPAGTHEYSLRFDGRSGLVTVDAGFFVHFDALEKHTKKALGYMCPWSAGATLLNAGANPWNYFLFEDRFATMQPAERSGIASEVIHPEARLQEAVRFLLDAHTRYALPLFRGLQTVRHLADFLGEYIRNGCTARCRPLPETAVYLWLLAAGTLGDDLKEIVELAKGIGSGYVGHDVNASVQSVLQYMASSKILKQ
jgi:hypothetical protein